MLSERQKEIQSTIESLRKRVDLLDSHKVVGYINDKQYAESLESISHEIDKLEEELGIKPKGIDAGEFMYANGIEKFNDSVERTNDIFAENIFKEETDDKFFI